MLSIRKINPMVRSIGTVGVVMGLVGAVTFAQLTSNQVVLADNTLTTDSAVIAIGTGLATPGTCTAPGSSAPGVSSASFKPNDTVTQNFCLENDSDFAQTLTATMVPSPLNSDAAAATTFTINCTGNGTTFSGEGTLTSNLNSWGPGTFGTALPAGARDACTASAKLSASYNGSGVNTIPTFAVNFVGTQVE